MLPTLWEYISLELIFCYCIYMSFEGFLRRGPTVQGPNCPGPNCPGPNGPGANCPGAQLSGGPNCQGAQLSGAQLSGTICLESSIKALHQIKKICLSKMHLCPKKKAHSILSGWWQIIARLLNISRRNLFPSFQKGISLTNLNCHIFTI